MKNKKELGKLGEKIACEYLVKNSFKIIEKNLTKPWGEIDIIAISPDKTLVFVEVKTVKHGFRISAENQMTSSKIKKFKRAASLYAGSHPELIKEEKGWRLDVITLTEKENGFELFHYENI